MRKGKVKLNGKEFEIEMAETLAEKARGLMHREYLHDDHGMLFSFPFESLYPFTMRNMKFPLDIIWINRQEKIVHIAKSLKPCRKLLCPPIMPWRKAKYVLELNAGTAKKLSLVNGDRVEIIFR